MKNFVLDYLQKRRDQKQYEVIQKRWELEKLKAEVQKMKEVKNEIHQSGT